jgi:hypothetical protein
VVVDTSVATVLVGTSVDMVLVAISRADMAAASGTGGGGVTALVRAGDGQTLTASTCGSAINS